MDIREFLTKMIKAEIKRNERATEEERERQELRSKKFKIMPKKTGHITKPSEYADIPDELFGDPVNYKYPIDPEHLIIAIRYFNHSKQRVAGGYTDKEWEIIGNRIANRTNGKYIYKDGKIIRAEKRQEGGDK